MQEVSSLRGLSSGIRQFVGIYGCKAPVYKHINKDIGPEVRTVWISLKNRAFKFLKDPLWDEKTILKKVRILGFIMGTEMTQRFSIFSCKNYFLNKGALKAVLSLGKACTMSQRISPLSGV